MVSYFSWKIVLSLPLLLCTQFPAFPYVSFAPRLSGFKRERVKIWPPAILILDFKAVAAVASRGMI